jgi:hypothetical protein
MAFELSQFGIGLKIIEPGGMKTDFFTRSFDAGHHPAYDALVAQVMNAITDPKQMDAYSTPEQIAEVVYEAATDGTDQLATWLAPTRKRPTPPACRLGRRHSERRLRSSSSGCGRPHDTLRRRTIRPVRTDCSRSGVRRG